MRQKWSVTTDYDLYLKIKQLSEETRITVSRLLDEAIEDLLIKHAKENQYKAEYEKNRESKNI